MASCFLRSTFVFDVQKTLLIELGVTPDTVLVTWAAGTWTWESFIGELKTDLSSEGVLTVEVNGLDFVDTTRPEGAIKLTWSENEKVVFKWSSGSTTVSPRYLGWPTGQGDVTEEAPPGPFEPPHVHRAGWYPARFPRWYPLFRLFQGRWRETSSGIVRGHLWSKKWGLEVHLKQIEAALVRLEAGQNSGHVGRALIALNDENASLEAFVEDLLEHEGTFEFRCVPGGPTWGNFSLVARGDARRVVAAPPNKPTSKSPERWDLVIAGEANDANFTTLDTLSIDVKSGSLGTQVLNRGKATTPTLIDLSGTVQPDDLVLLHINARNENSSDLAANLWKDGLGTERWSRLTGIADNQSGYARETTDEVWIRAEDPAAALWYSWSNTPGAGTSGLSVYVKHVIRGLSWL